MHSGVIMELKSAGKTISDKALKELSQKAYTQIEQHFYDTEFKKQKIKNVLKYGIAFSGNRVEITQSNGRSASNQSR